MGSTYDNWFHKIMGRAGKTSAGWRGVFGIIGSLAYIINIYSLFWLVPQMLKSGIENLGARSTGVDTTKHQNSVKFLNKLGNLIVQIASTFIIWLAHLVATKSWWYYCWVFFIVSVPTYMLIRYFSEDAYTPNAAHY